MPKNYLEPNFEQPYNTWQQDPSPANATNLLKAVNPVLTAAIRSYAVQSSPTITSRAKIMALDAMKRYDPTKAKLRTHLMYQLQGLRRHSAKEQQILSVPEQVGLELGNLKEAENSLRDELGREPSSMEVSDYMGIPLKRLSYIRKAKPSYAEGSFHRSTDEGEDIYTPAIQGAPNQEHWNEFVYGDLHPIDQLIMDHSFATHGLPMLSNKDIAKKLKISAGAVSQRKAKIQEKLNLREELGF